MGLIAIARRRWYVWSWRARYWWMDTRQGEQAHALFVCMAAIVCIVELIRMFIAVALPPPPNQPVKAIYWWIIQLIILVVSAAISYAMRPKPKAPAAQKGEAPTTEDGQSAKKYFGTCWIGDEFILAWKMVGTVKIKAKGGK